MDQWLLAVTSDPAAKGSAKDLEVAGAGPVHCRFSIPPSFLTMCSSERCLSDLHQLETSCSYPIEAHKHPLHRDHSVSHCWCSGCDEREEDPGHGDRPAIGAPGEARTLLAG